MTRAATREAGEARRNFETRDHIKAWQPIAGAPKDGSRIRLAHSEASCSTFGMWDAAQGRWRLEAFFILPGGPYGRMCIEPDLWASLDALARKGRRANERLRR